MLEEFGHLEMAIFVLSWSIVNRGEPRSEHFDHQRWDVVLDLLLQEIPWDCSVKNNCNTVKSLNTLG